MLNKIDLPILSVIYGISNGDFQISRKISGFQRRFPDFTKDFRIPQEISGKVYEISASGGPLGLYGGMHSSITSLSLLCTLGSGVFRGT